MSDRKHIRYVRIPTIDGMAAKFPVSRHVLTLPSRRKLQLWRPSLVQRAAALTLVLSLFVSSYGITYGQLQSTLAYFRDDESSTNNILQAGALDFVVSPEGDVSGIIEAGEHLVVPVMTPEPGTFPTMYRVTVEEVGGPNLLCTLLDAEATTTPFTYGPADLLPLAVTATTTSGAWPLELSLPSAPGLVDGDECVVDLVYRGWHKDVPENTGYTDEERVRLTLTYTLNSSVFDIVLNEFLPFPDGIAYDFDFGDDGSDMPQGEWIELYNKGAAPVDVLGWYITDASGGGGNTHAVIDGTNTIPASTIVAPGAWIVVYMNKPTLNNVADEIHLYTDNDVEVDFVSYEQPSDGCFKEPSPGESNPADLPTGTPGNGGQADCNQAQVAPNKSYARIPDGTGAWIDPVPTPGAPNIPDPELIPEPEVQGASTEDESPLEEATSTPETEEETTYTQEESASEESAPEQGNWSASTPAPNPTPLNPPGEEATEPTETTEAPVEAPTDTNESQVNEDAALPEEEEEPATPQEEPQPEPEQEPDTSEEQLTEPSSPVDVPPPPPEAPAEPPPESE